MQRLSDWCETNNIDIEECNKKNSDSFCPSERTIVLYKRQPTSVKKNTLIHEIGHVLIFLARVRNKNRKVVGRTLREFDRPIRTWSDRVAILMEEIEAWDRGERLAKKLGVRFDKKQFHRERALAVASYIKFFGQTKRC